MGFAFFDHGRPKDLSFRYIVTTGNEACLEASDFAEFIVDEGKTDAILMLIEDIKNVATFERAAGKALRAGKPLIVNRLGASEAGARAIAAHTAARGNDAEYRALFARYGVIESNDLDEMVDIAAAFVNMGKRLPAGKRVAICSSSGGGGAWVADACALAGLDMPLLDDATRAQDRRVPAALWLLAEPGRRHGAGHPRARLCGVRAPRRRVAERRRRHPGGHRPPSALPAGGPRAPDRARPRREEAGAAVELHAARRGLRRPVERGGLAAVHQRAQLRPRHARDGGLSAVRARPEAHTG